ncbi:MAG: hypothetical protein EPN55_06875 [Gammaproteobacteria bacterium]|nr:MAG: hypothetical protein EPN55_06875 [Gammaproteobacteria bacterium]
MNIGIILDNPKREIDGVLLLTYQLARQGHDVYIIPMYQQGHDVPLLKLDGIIVNYARLNNKSFLRAYKELGITVFVLDSEGGVIAEKDIPTPSNPSLMRNTGVQEYIDHYLFWGKTQRDAFARAGMLPDDRLHVTGCPRYDLCSTRWRSLLEYPRRDYILVNTNFSTINPLFTGTAKSEMDVFHSAGWDAGYVRDLFADLHGVFRKYLDTVAELAARNQDRMFVVRPHPFENPAVYERTYAAHRNVIVDGTGSVFNVIHHATCVLHLNCQTAVETILLDKLPVSMEFLNTGLLLRHWSLPSEISYCANSPEELDAIVKDPEKYRTQYPLVQIHERYIQPWFHINDGNASMRVADVVRAHTNPARGAGWLRRLAMSLAGCLEQPRLLQRAQSLLMSLVGSRAVSNLRRRLNAARRTKYIECEFVESGVNRIARHDGADISFQATHARGLGTGLPLATLRVTAA